MAKRRVVNNKRVLILCEGFTEEVYAKALRTEFLPRSIQRVVTIDVVRHKKNDPLNLIAEAKARVRKAKKARVAYDDVWLFFDDDNSPHLARVLADAEKQGFKLAFTSICIEYWYILHFEDCGRSFANGDECERYLRKFWTTYHKTRINHFKELEGKLDVAIKHALSLQKRNSQTSVVDAKPYTSVHKLVEFFKELGENG